MGRRAVGCIVVVVEGRAKGEWIGEWREMRLYV